MYKISVAILLINGLLITSAKPQYGPPGGASYGGSAPAPAPAPAPQPQTAPAVPSYAAPASAPQPQAAPAPPPPPPAAPQGPPPAAPPTGGAPAKSGDLTVQCKASPDASGTIKYDCSGANKDAITLKTEHILWLESQSGTSQNLDIEIPNYNIDEFIKAAYKQLGPQEGAKINVLLKKPEVTYNAAKDDAPKQAQQPPAVSLNYQPVDKVSVHYPTQKAYSNGGDNRAAPQPGPGPAPAPAPLPAPAPQPAPAPARQGGGGAYSRPLRQSGTSYYFYRQ